MCENLQHILGKSRDKLKARGNSSSASPRMREELPCIPVEDRTCLVCKQDQVEDEQHFLMFCNGYNVLRQELINFILSEDVAFVNLTALDRIKY